MTLTTDTARGLVLDGRYRIEEVIGVGGMATVYRASDLQLERDVAVKLFPPTPAEDERLRQEAEISVLATLSHPGLVTLLDAGSCFAGGPMPQTYMVMELVAGPTLADLVRQGPLTPAATAMIGRQLADALATAHDGQVVHRDVKPANVLFVEPLGDDVVGVRVKLADFGIARILDAARLTVTGLTMGTATYLSPEQAAGSAVGPPTDVYALGLVLLECLTGEKAFTGTVVEVAAARLTTSPAIPTSLGPEWGSLLAAMTRRDPDERMGLGEVARRLDDLAAAATGPTADVTMVLEAVTAPMTRAAADAVSDGVASVADAGDGAPVGTDAAGTAAAGGPHPAASRPHRSLVLRRRHWRLAVRGARLRRPGRPGAAPGAAPGGGVRRRLGVAWSAAAVVVVVLGVVLAVALPGVEPPAVGGTVAPPDVQGALGAALSDLVESVQP